MKNNELIKSKIGDYSMGKIKFYQYDGLHCSFCGKHKDSICYLVQEQPSLISICDECIKLATIRVEELKNKKNKEIPI